MPGHDSDSGYDSGRERSERKPFAYALLRVVPHVERGECLNVGVAVYCRQHAFLDLRAGLDEARLASLAPDLDPEPVRSQLSALQAAVRGNPAAGALGALPQSERFGWLVAPSSTIIQPSDVHTGLTDDPAATLERLFATLVQ
ncbi:MAG: hypothetical protein QOG15_1490 [Solirubrobacteraceae bacterium]|nr:hypothetical protein [Solirubrobacteraceae bacterium]